MTRSTDLVSLGSGSTARAPRAPPEPCSGAYAHPVQPQADGLNKDALNIFEPVLDRFGNCLSFHFFWASCSFDMFEIRYKTRGTRSLCGRNLSPIPPKLALSHL